MIPHIPHIPAIPQGFGSQEVKLVGERLNYELLEGSGPYRGDSARNSEQCCRKKACWHMGGGRKQEEWGAQHTLNEEGT